MRNRKILYIMLLVVLLIGIVVVPAFADAGNFSGHSDFGGSSSGGSWSGSGGSFGGSGLWALFALSGARGNTGGIIFIIIVVFMVLNVIKKRRNTSGERPAFTSFSDLMPIHTLQEVDSSFSETAMKEKISNLYVQMQDAWQKKKFESMRPFMTDTLYNQFLRQLDELIRAGYTNYIERIAVLDVRLEGWKSDEINDIIVATVSTRITDYTVEDKTDKVVGGSKKAEKFMCYEWTLIRSKGMKTATPLGEGSDGAKTVNCPSCGAPVEMNQSSKCPYCGSVLYADDFNWVISNIRGVSQKTK